MPLVLVSDTSVLVDLHRGEILAVALRLPFEFAVPDLLYERELRDRKAPAVEGLLTVMSLDEAGVELAAEYRRREPRLSLPDAFALALAKIGGHTLLAGDAALRAAADEEAVECHGVLWVLDQLDSSGIATASVLHAALTAIAGHPRCRLPRSEVRKRLDAWA